MKDISKEKRLAEFASNHSKQDFRLLVIFKTIKTRAEEELAKRKIEFDDSILNEVCAEKANELLPHERDINEEEFSALLEKIKTKTEEKYANGSQVVKR